MSNTKEKNNRIIGRNGVWEALKSGRPIEQIVLLPQKSGFFEKIRKVANEKNIPLTYETVQFFEKQFPKENHQGIMAKVKPYEYASVEDILAVAKKRQQPPFVIILDGIEDPHNLGAVMRSAEGAGAHGVIIGKKNGVGLTYGVAKASAGAIEYLPCAKVTNMVSTIKALQEQGLWIVAGDMEGQDYTGLDYTGPMALVIGNEGKGLRRLVREQCDFIASIPLCGRISSLNASVAAGIIMYEVQRQRKG